MKHCLINTSFYRASYFTAYAIAVLIIDQKIGQIAMPQIAVKSIMACHFQKPVNALAAQYSQCPLFLVALMLIFHQPYHILKQLFLSELPIND